MSGQAWHSADRRFADRRGVARRIKSVVPESLYRRGVVLFNSLMRLVPMEAKYTVGEWLRRNQPPYDVLRPGDVAVQVGAPSDILDSGRSRAVHFARRVGRDGIVFVLEPDPESAARLSAYATRAGVGQLQVIPKGAWSEADTLTFLLSRVHPASSLVLGTKELSDEPHDYRAYERKEIPVVTLDEAIPSDLQPRVRLVSVTTNGSEIPIVDGMRGVLSRARPYLSMAKAGPDFIEHVEALGYRCTSNDDRGFFFAPAE